MTSMSVTIEDASSQYLDELYTIETRCFEKEAFTKRQIGNLLADYNSVSLVAKENCDIVGFIIGTIYVEANSLIGHILTLDVSPTVRRRGIARRLLREIEKIFRGRGVTSCRLEAREDNVAALGLYQKLGYKRIAKIANYYGKTNGIHLRKDLTRSP
jgi:ribosomal-protein-alanine acetyltransferase